MIFNLTPTFPEWVKARIISHSIMLGLGYSLLGNTWPSNRGQSHLAALKAHLKVGAILLLTILLQLINELRMEVIHKQQLRALFKVDLVLHASEELYRLLENALGV